MSTSTYFFVTFSYFEYLVIAYYTMQPPVRSYSVNFDIGLFAGYTFYNYQISGLLLT